MEMLLVVLGKEHLLLIQQEHYNYNLQIQVFKLLVLEILLLYLVLEQGQLEQQVGQHLQIMVVFLLEKNLVKLLI